jgi:hypothetical protein
MHGYICNRRIDDHPLNNLHGLNPIRHITNTMPKLLQSFYMKLLIANNISKKSRFERDLLFCVQYKQYMNCG